LHPDVASASRSQRHDERPIGELMLLEIEEAGADVPEACVPLAGLVP